MTEIPQSENSDNICRQLFYQVKANLLLHKRNIYSYFVLLVLQKFLICVIFI